MRQVAPRRGRGPDRSCESRLIFEAFLSCGEDCIEKHLAADELARLANNLKHYRRDHMDEYARIGIKVDGSRIVLYDREAVGLAGA